ncbi:MAG: methionine adenosyltransferase [Eubacteriaceae bacterium]|nr:methionine adenosyltransferase [Eubacteriaceae bacterium]
MATFFTSESVTEGHPDKMCDMISDAVLDAYLDSDPHARVACETSASPGLIHVMGEISSKATVDIEEVVRNTIREVGYTHRLGGFDADCCSVITSINKQSRDIAAGVDRNGSSSQRSLGAGDQGMMFGYACDETDVWMPAAITLAHQIAQKLAVVRKEKELIYLCPDGKSQITVEYDGGKPFRVDTVVVAAQHLSSVRLSRIRRDIKEKVIKEIIPSDWMDVHTKTIVNGTGRFVTGGPMADVGLTGRKIIVDTYGGAAKHGGGAFSGKDPTKVDRTGSYAMRYLAKNIVASGAASRCEIQIAYVIGRAQPVSLDLDTFGTEKVAVQKLIEIIQKKIDLRPAAWIERFNLKRPIYKALAAYGHFGRAELDLPWEKLDIVKLFQS